MSEPNVIAHLLELRPMLRQLLRFGPAETREGLAEVLGGIAQLDEALTAEAARGIAALEAALAAEDGPPDEPDAPCV